MNGSKPASSSLDPLRTAVLAALAAAIVSACSGGTPAPQSGPATTGTGARADGKPAAAGGSTAATVAARPASGAASGSGNASAAAPTVDPSVALKPSTLSTTASSEDGGETDAPLTVRFSVAVQEGSGRAPYRHVWDFGDATDAVEGAAPTHVYRLPGNFRASVMTVDADGQYDQDWVDVLVLPNYEAMGLSPEELKKRVEAGREAARKALEGLRDGVGTLPGVQPGAASP